jgi:hypothetical protein
MLAAAFRPAAVGAESAAPPSLLGQWEGVAQEIRGGQKVASPFRIEVTRQEGPLLWADDVWHPLDKATGKPSAQTQRDQMLGSLNPDGTGGVLAKQDARFSFRVLEANRLEVEFVCIRETEPAAFVMVLHRAGTPAPAAPAKPRFPDLAGAWHGSYRYPAKTGAIDDEFHIEVVRQDGECLWADDVWKPLDPATGKPGTVEKRERLVGGLSFDGKRGVLAKPDVRFAFTVVDANRLDMEFARFGGAAEAPMGFYVTFTRQPGGLAKAKPVALPDLRGNWEGDTYYPQPDGRKPSHLRIEVTKQDGALLWADNVWHPLDPATQQPGAKVARDGMAGSLHPDGTAGILAKAGARFSFKVLAPDRMLVEFVRLRAGMEPPTAFYAVLARQKQGAGR